MTRRTVLLATITLVMARVSLAVESQRPMLGTPEQNVGVENLWRSSPVYSVSFSGDGKWIASGSSDNTVRVWDAATGKELQRLEGHSDWVRAGVTGDPRVMRLLSMACSW
jgi:WD40 repeat protein